MLPDCNCLSAGFSSILLCCNKPSPLLPLFFSTAPAAGNEHVHAIGVFYTPPGFTEAEQVIGLNKQGIPCSINLSLAYNWGVPKSILCA